MLAKLSAYFAKKNLPKGKKALHSKIKYQEEASQALASAKWLWQNSGFSTSLVITLGRACYGMEEKFQYGMSKAGE